jgi:acyl carrier protein
MDPLELDLKRLIVDALNLEGVKPEDIDSEAPLFGEGLGLDSIDALELGVALRKKYGLVLTANDSTTRESFRSVRALAGLVSRQSGTTQGAA